VEIQASTLQILNTLYVTTPESYLRLENDTIRVEVEREDGSTASFTAIVRIDGAAEVDYFRHGGILQMVLREMLGG